MRYHSSRNTIGLFTCFTSACSCQPAASSAALSLPGDCHDVPWSDHLILLNIYYDFDDPSCKAGSARTLDRMKSGDPVSEPLRSRETSDSVASEGCRLRSSAGKGERDRRSGVHDVVMRRFRRRAHCAQHSQSGVCRFGWMATAIATLLVSDQRSRFECHFVRRLRCYVR